MTDHVLVSQAGGVCELRLNRPEKRNAITFAMYDMLWDALVRAEADDSIRAILLSGAGASFTAGNDLMDFVGRPLGGGGEAARPRPAKQMKCMSPPQTSSGSPT